MFIKNILFINIEYYEIISVAQYLHFGDNESSRIIQMTSILKLLHKGFLIKIF